jgi:hypothetical protein
MDGISAMGIRQLKSFFVINFANTESCQTMNGHSGTQYLQQTSKRPYFLIRPRRLHATHPRVSDELSHVLIGMHDDS